MREYDISDTDLFNMFYHLDVTRSGAVTRCEFESAMLELGVPTDQAARVFDALDVDGDGVLSLDDWTHERVQGLARHISLRMIRRQVVGNNPLTAKRPPSSVTDQKVAMEVLLARLGVTAKTNFLHVKGLFDSMDADGSGAVDGEELTLTVERILRQKIARGVKEQMLKRFDRNGDGAISPSEFLGKVVSNPMATLYAFQARANPIL